MQMERVGQPKSYRGHHCSECGVPISPYSRGKCRSCGYRGLKREVPENFMAVLTQQGSAGAAKTFKASLGTVTRWRREIGMNPQERARKPSMHGPSSYRSRGFKLQPLICVRDLSPAGRAAEFLRKWGSVFRCDRVGKPDAKGDFWKRNFAILTDQDIIARARRLGWIEAEW